jgi:ATP-dependent helicase/nuclease subunit A
VGYVDLVAADGRGLAVIDFKTDAPPAGDVATTHPAYVEQVRSYARLLEELGVAAAGTVRAGLLFSAEDQVRRVVHPEWVPANGRESGHMRGLRLP